MWYLIASNLKGPLSIIALFKDASETYQLTIFATLRDPHLCNQAASPNRSTILPELFGLPKLNLSSHTVNDTCSKLKAPERPAH